MPRNIEDAFGPGAHHRGRRPGDLQKVRGDIPFMLAAAMGPADASCRENLDAGSIGKKHRGRDRGRGRAALADGGSKVAPAGFQDMLVPRQAFEFAIAESDRGAARQNGDRGRDRSFARTAASAALAVSRFKGNGNPWAMSVDSSATTGRFACRAAATSGCNCNTSALNPLAD